MSTLVSQALRWIGLLIGSIAVISCGDPEANQEDTPARAALQPVGAPSERTRGGEELLVDPFIPPRFGEDDEQKYPYTRFDPAREVELTPPPESEKVALENRSMEIWVDGDKLLERVRKGSAYKHIREKLLERHTKSELLRLNLDETLVMHFAGEFLRAGEASVVMKGSGYRPTRILIVPWSTRSAPNAHGHGGVEFRLPNGEALFRESTWIE